MRKRILRKSIAIFLLLVIVGNVVAPTVSYALTSGPTAPEATSFEPVDTTDMVNLATGDFTYNIPLLEVPGPAGGYPLSLSYHAGIQPNEDASWVGLGWSLNPGAISRLVNGYPDDNNGIEGYKRSFWEGGSRETGSIGLSIGLQNGASVSAGLSFSNDTYEGFGVGFQLGVDVGLNLNSKNNLDEKNRTSIGVSVSVSPNGKVSASASVGAINLDSENGFSGNMSFKSTSISISSSGLSVSTPIGGIRKDIVNSKSGKITSESTTGGGNIPILPGLNIRISRTFERYWSDETDEVLTYGTLYNLKNQLSVSDFDSKTFDVYDLPDVNMITESDLEKVRGGTFPDYDRYNVSAQGLSGSMRPFHFQDNLYRRNRKNGENYEIVNNPLSVVGKLAGFRFENDFSNKYLYQSDEFFYSQAKGDFDYNFLNSINTGNNNNNGLINDKLIGSKNIDWFTNEQIANGFARSKGFIESKSRTREANGTMSKKIGGFKITNESGVVYHYSLPVYEKNEFTYSGWVDDHGKHYFNTLTNPSPYAYTWLLTAVTGPDYVDRGEIGLLDDQDWGYWVEFNYGLWTGQYSWRNPAQGYTIDIDNKFKSFSSGSKELFYLNTIKTKTHVAIFEKEIRPDGKGIAVAGGPLVNSFENNSVSIIDPSFEPGIDVDLKLKYPVATLRLNSIYLLKRSDYEILGGDYLASAGNEYNHTWTTSIWLGTIQDYVVKTYQWHNPKSVIDKFDINSEIKNKAIKIIDFDFDYSLAPGTVNSFDENGNLYVPLPNKSLVNQKMGKLTLIGINFLGKSGNSSLPSTKFEYAKNFPYEADKFDSWGFYKSDFPNTGNENVDRMVTPTSALDVDAWSLTKVTNSLGSITEIAYESDSFKSELFGQSAPFRIESLTPTTLKLKDVQENAYFKPNDRIILKLSLIRTEFNADTSPHFTEIGYVPWSVETIVESVSDDALVVAPINFPKINYGSGHYINSGFFLGNVGLLGGSGWEFGGGVRVKSIETKDSQRGIAFVTSYSYESPSDGSQSGVTSYKPIVMDKYYTKNLPETHQGVKTLKEALNNDLAKIISLSRVMPGPGVIYEFVTVRNSIKDTNNISREVENYSVFHFEIFDFSLIDFFKERPDNLVSRKIAIKNYSSRVGNLKSTKVFSRDGVLLSQIVNKYLHDEIDIANINNNDPELDDKFEANIKLYEPLIYSKLKGQGIIQETFANARNGWRVISRYETYPSVKMSTQVTNFKTGVNKTEFNLGFDFYSGKVIKSLELDELGNSFVTEIIPAYQIYPSMGPSLQGGLNMLTQEGAVQKFTVTEDYKLNPIEVNKRSLISASAQTWSDQIPVMGAAGNNQTAFQSGIWRKKSTFSYTGDQYAPLATTGDGLVAAASFQPFANWTNDAPQAGWQKNATITKYDYNSHAIEATDVNDKFAATKFSYDHSQVLATATNANYGELAYSGVEESLQQDQFYHATNFPFKAVGGGVYVSDESTLSSTAHTGVKSVQTPIAKKAFRYSFDADNKNYQVSVWASRNDAKIKYKLNNGSALEAVMDGAKKSGDWYLLTASIPTGATGVLEIWCEATAATTLFDDFRMHPVQAAMTSYVYNNWGELTHILDNNNIYTKYEYDGMGRLIKTYRERLQPTDQSPAVSKISEVAYHYALSSPAFMIPIQTSVSSGNGTITQNVNVLPGGTAVIYTANACDNLNYLSKVYADGKLLSTAGSGPLAAAVTLYDGAKAFVENGVVKLTGVQGNHKVRAEFALPPTNLQPYAVCELTQPNNCPTNRYFIMTPNSCGGYDQSNITYLWTELSPAIQANTSPCPTIDPNSNCNQLQPQN